MDLTRVRFTVRRMMGAVAIAALVSLAAARVCREFPDTERRVASLFACVAVAAYSVGSVRRPWIFGTPVLLVWSCTPVVDHPDISILSMSINACGIGWFIGAPAGWISRRLTAAGHPPPVASEPPGPERVEREVPQRAFPGAGCGPHRDGTCREDEVGGEPDRGGRRDPHDPGERPSPMPSPGP